MAHAGAGMIHHSYIKPGKCSNWLATGTIYHTKLKQNTSSVMSVLQKQHQSMWKCLTKNNSLTDLNLRLFWPCYKCTWFKQEVQFKSLQSMDLKCSRHFNINAVYWALSNPQSLKIHKNCTPWNATWSPCNLIQNSCDGSTHCHFV